MRCSASAGPRPLHVLVMLLAGCVPVTDAMQRTLHIGPHAFQVEVADTPHQRAHGLMGRPDLAADGGMLFVFEYPGRHCFWMRDTPLPLSIAFIDATGRIAGLADMLPRSETRHCPGVDIRYALEVRQGEFQRRGITLHAQVDGLPK
ncbi:DUF192 domain-containing protein [Thiobacillus sp.]